MHWLERDLHRSDRAIEGGADERATKYARALSHAPVYSLGRVAPQLGVIRHPLARTLAWLRAGKIRTMVDLMGKEIVVISPRGAPPSSAGMHGSYWQAGGRTSMPALRVGPRISRLDSFDPADRQGTGGTM